MTIRTPAHDARSVEWTFPIDSGRLRQGDILECSKDAAGETYALAMVVTSDCDLAQHKHHGRITCIPIYTLESYLVTFGFRKELEHLRQELGDRCIKLANEARLEQDLRPLSSERLVAWIGEQPPEQIAGQLRLEGKRAVGFVRAAKAIQLQVVADNDLASIAAWCHDARLALNQKSPGPLAVLQKKLDSVLSSPPGDAYLLSEVSEQHRSGYVLALRMAREIRAEKIGVLPSHRDMEWRRVSTLKDIYRFSVCQQFAAVFTSVGLPDAQNESVRLCGELLMHELSPTLSREAQ